MWWTRQCHAGGSKMWGWLGSRLLQPKWRVGPILQLGGTPRPPGGQTVACRGPVHGLLSLHDTSLTKWSFYQPEHT